MLGVALFFFGDGLAQGVRKQRQLGIKVAVGKLAMLGHKNPKDGTVEHIYCGNITHNTHTKCNYHKYYEVVNT